MKGISTWAPCLKAPRDGEAAVEAPDGAAVPVPSCPGCGLRGRRIATRTAIAVTSEPLPARQQLFVCAAPDCSLIYYGAAGAHIAASALRLRPTWKGGDVLCFCFGHRLAELDGGASSRDADGDDLVSRIERRVRAGDCACELRNPSGRCCLPEIARSRSTLRS